MNMVKTSGSAKHKVTQKATIVWVIRNNGRAMFPALEP